MYRGFSKEPLVKDQLVRLFDMLWGEKSREFLGGDSGFGDTILN